AAWTSNNPVRAESVHGRRISRPSRGSWRFRHRYSSRSLSVSEPDIADEIAVRLAIGADRVGGKTVVGIAHRDAGHDHLFLGDVSDLAHDIRAHDALPVDDATEAAIPCGEHQAVAQC